MWLQQESILFGLLKVSQALLDLVASGLAGSQQWPAGQWVGRPVVGVPVGWQVGGSHASQWQWHIGGGLPVLSVYCVVEKPFTD
jgi:hypothetical protein